ncbi:hypothetical protein [Pseudomonas caspiana]|uniref:Phage abortive infection protein n=1 Tax=Pseudomonas caspiana TaxID=1451454 RepID=A0A1Y3P843_9PSED|nr:hypothetical protein [Pseudomonas caspiana]OUM73743.1 hypothetical protein AUC60_11775 [Pseudomonas caspiana]
MHRKLGLIIFVVIAMSVTLVVLPWVATFHNAPLSTTPADWGVFGDYFGGVLSIPVSIFGFVALLITIKIQREAMEMQMAALKAQWKSIEQDKEARDDEVYSRQSLECFNEALSKLINPTDGRLYRNRVAWLESARLILTAKNLSARITSKSVRETYEAAEKVLRSRFSTLLNPDNNPDTIQPTYFYVMDWDRWMENRRQQPIDKTSAFVIYRFASWQRDEFDELDEIRDEVDPQLINRRYFGARQYVEHGDIDNC